MCAPCGRLEVLLFVPKWFNIIGCDRMLGHSALTGAAYSILNIARYMDP